MKFLRDCATHCNSGLSNGSARLYSCLLRSWAEASRSVDSVILGNASKMTLFQFQQEQETKYLELGTARDRLPFKKLCKKGTHQGPLLQVEEYIKELAFDYDHEGVQTVIEKLRKAISKLPKIDLDLSSHSSFLSAYSQKTQVSNPAVVFKWPCKTNKRQTVLRARSSKSSYLHPSVRMTAEIEL